jgi:hypothetical protein
MNTCRLPFQFSAFECTQGAAILEKFLADRDGDEMSSMSELSAVEWRTLNVAGQL